MRWDTTPRERALIEQIAERYCELIGDDGEHAVTDRRMDLTALHLNGCPLDLQRLARANDFSLIHDVAGIRNNIDRATGRLREPASERDRFIPRCARGEGAT